MAGKLGPKEKAAQKAALAEAAKAQKDAEAAERAAAADWNVGAKDSKKEREAAEKEMEKARKAAELRELMAQEEADISGIVIKKKTSKKKKDDDFAMLNAALSAAPKTKAQKEAEAKKKETEERKKKEAENAEAARAVAAVAEKERKELERRGIVTNHTDDLMIKPQNSLDDNDIDVSGLEAAIGALSTRSGGSAGETVFKKVNRKALYEAYSERMMPEMREMNPGLKLSQYKDRIFESWKKSPENPDNQKA